MKASEIDIKAESKKIISHLKNRLQGKEDFIPMIFFVAFILSCVYFWYNYIYRPGWNEAKKQEYIQSRGKDTVFNEQKYNNVISKLDERRKKFESSSSKTDDIFRLKK
jgi:hypothetical protein